MNMSKKVDLCQKMRYVRFQEITQFLHRSFSPKASAWAVDFMRSRLITAASFCPKTDLNYLLSPLHCLQYTVVLFS
jgi:hypothetical protein